MKAKYCCATVRVEGAGILLIVDHCGGPPDRIFQEILLGVLGLNTSVGVPKCLRLIDVARREDVYN